MLVDLGFSFSKNEMYHSFEITEIYYFFLGKNFVKLRDGFTNEISK